MPRFTPEIEIYLERIAKAETIDEANDIFIELTLAWPYSGEPGHNIPELMQHIMSMNVNVHARDQLAFINVCERWGVTGVKYFLSIGANPNIQHGAPLLISILTHQKIEILETLIDAGALISEEIVRLANHDSYICETKWWTEYGSILRDRRLCSVGNFIAFKDYSSWSGENLTAISLFIERKMDPVMLTQKYLLHGLNQKTRDTLSYFQQKGIDLSALIADINKPGN